MGTISKGQKTVASEVQFFRYLDISLADFDGTDKASMAAGMLDPDGYNHWGEGFYVMPGASGDLEVLSYTDWVRNEKVVNDALRQILPACAAGIFHPVRVVKVYAAGSAATEVAIGN